MKHDHLEKKNALLMVIDVQNAYDEGRAWECRDIRKRINNICRLVDENACGDTIFTAYIAERDAQGVWQDYNEEYKDIAFDDELNAIVPGLQKYLSRYPLYNKGTFSALKNPEVLAACRKADHVVITGVVAECCVISTILELVDHGIYVVYITDAIAGANEENEKATERVFSGIEPLHIRRMTTEEYLNM